MTERETLDEGQGFDLTMGLRFRAKCIQSAQAENFPNPFLVGCTWRSAGTGGCWYSRKRWCTIANGVTRWRHQGKLMLRTVPQCQDPEERMVCSAGLSKDLTSLCTFHVLFLHVSVHVSVNIMISLSMFHYLVDFHCEIFVKWNYSVYTSRIMKSYKYFFLISYSTLNFSNSYFQAKIKFFSLLDFISQIFLNFNILRFLINFKLLKNFELKILRSLQLAKK